MVQTDILEEVRHFADTEIRPYANAHESEGGFPRSLIAKMAANGYMGAAIPSTYGGLGLDPIQYGLFTETIGMASDSVRAMLTVHTSLVGETILRCGNARQKEQLLPAIAGGEIIAAFGLTEPDTGTDAKNIRTTYTKTADGGFLLNGKKKWITMGALADLLLVIAASDGRQTAFLVDCKSPGVTVSPMQGLMAGGATHIAEILLEDVTVKEEDILGMEGNGFAYIANTALDFGRYSVAWGGAAIAGEALNAMVAYSRKRKQFGKSISSFQLVRGLIGDAVTQLHASRALCLRAGQQRKEKYRDAVMTTIIAKYHASRTACHVTADALQIHGANGFSSQYPVGRLFREAKTLEIIEGTSQVLQEAIAEHAIYQ
jgi:alkylation response protein AidB-like acyl-CoA dehydrogenase